MGDQLRVVFRNFPLSEMHPDAVPAAVFAESAALEGDFWSAHDWLYAHQDQLGAQGLAQAASDLHLDAGALDRHRQAAQDRVVADARSGEQSGVPGTPAFFINGQLFQGSWDEQGLLAALRNAADWG